MNATKGIVLGMIVGFMTSRVVGPLVRGII
jgi:hypothetical protein